MAGSCLLVALVAGAATAAPVLARPDAATIFEAPRELRSANPVLRDATLRAGECSPGSDLGRLADALLFASHRGYRVRRPAGL